MLEAQAEPSVGDLLRALARDTGVLIRQELRLAGTEMSAKAERVVHSAAVIATGGALVLAGGLALLAAAIAGLATHLPLWASALSVGLVVMAAGYLLVNRGLSAMKRIDPLPVETINTLKADAEWAKEQVR